jgi:hypothetical protein
MAMRAELFAATWLCAACAEQGGEGALSVRISGEEAALGGYPVGDGDDEIAFLDGWTLEFQKVIVSLSHFSMATADGEDAQLDVEPVVADLHKGTPELWRFEGLGAQRWDEVGYRYEKPSSKSRAVNDVSDSDLERMENEGYSLLIEGVARQDTQSVAFSFGFPLAIDVLHCQNGLDGTDGVVVRDNAVTNAEVTVHLDHLFFDSYATEAPNLRFDPMAAMAEAGKLSVEDLEGQDNLSEIKGPDGAPLDIAYDPGSAFHPVPKNLAEYVISAAETTGHWMGEGHCEYHRR